MHRSILSRDACVAVWCSLESSWSWQSRVLQKVSILDSLQRLGLCPWVTSCATRSSHFTLRLEANPHGWLVLHWLSMTVSDILIYDIYIYITVWFFWINPKESFSVAELQSLRRWSCNRKQFPCQGFEIAREETVKFLDTFKASATSQISPVDTLSSPVTRSTSMIR